MPASGVTRNDIVEKTNLGVGATTLAGVLVNEGGNSILHQTTLTLTNVAATITDNGTSNGWGGVAVYNFPRNLVGRVTAVCNLTLAGDTNLTTTAAVVAAVGTAATGSATLSTTSANIVPSTACTMTARASAMKGITTTTLALVDATTTSGSATSAILNLGVPDAGISANATVTVNGTIVLTWSHLGDV